MNSEGTRETIDRTIHLYPIGLLIFGTETQTATVIDENFTPALSRIQTECRHSILLMSKVLHRCLLC